MPQKDLTPDRRIDPCPDPRFGNMSEAEPLGRHARLPIGRLVTGAVLLAGVVQGLAARPLGVPTGDPELRVNGVDANYTTSKLFVDEVAGDAVPLTIVFRPNAADVNPATVQTFTNLNRRDRAQVDANGDGIEDGIVPPSGDVVGTGDENYYQAHAMAATGNAGEFTVTLQARRTGAYRLTARYQTAAAPGRWVYYTRDGRRDHAITVSPRAARDMVMYELNTLVVESTLEAGGPTFRSRSTFDDLLGAPETFTDGNGNGTRDGGEPFRDTNGNNIFDAPGTAQTSSFPDTDGFDRVNLSYLRNLGVNWLWFQPIHPQGVAGRQVDPDTGQPYEVGSPYAVRNFFQVSPLMGSDNTEADARLEFQNFVRESDGAGLHVMLDAPFNHTAHDAEVSDQGMALFGGTAASQMRNTELRFFSRAGNYCERADLPHPALAVAPDRGDFGKFEDTLDVFFGRYSALVCRNPDDNNQFRDERDAFDESSLLGADGAVTRNVWKYFAEYVLYWLAQTGCAPGTSTADQAVRGIDGLRADFGQGLPPRAWEYIVNKTRTRKWAFVFMAESLDGGPVTYRSNRHFDVLNEQIVFQLAAATTAGNYRAIFEERRRAYGEGLVLLNSTSHDEANYTDPFEALVRFCVNGSIDGVPMIFFGQELGISGSSFGFSRYELNFGKRIPHFKKFNSLAPAWADESFVLDQLYPVYQAVATARHSSPALRSANRFFLDLVGGSTHPRMFAVAKFETRNGSPRSNDVVFAFANLDRNDDQQGSFDINQDADRNGVNDYGIDPARFYNVTNIAAYRARDPRRADAFLFRGSGPGGSIRGSELLANGLFVSMKKVPATDGDWATGPYEAQYLKLHDVTP
jgi:Alpha amylase, catalytic domain